MRTQQGRLELAQEHALTALAAADMAGLDRSRRVSFSAQADIAITADNLDAAEDYLLKALERDQAIGGEEESGGTLVSRGALYHRRGNDQTAVPYFQQGLEMVRSAGHPGMAAYCLEAVAVIAVDQGMVESAARLLGAVASADPGIAVYRFTSEQADYERVLERTRSMLGAAAFATAFEAGQGWPVSTALAEALDLTNRWAHEMVPASVGQSVMPCRELPASQP